MKYPVTKELKTAIDTIFADPRVGLRYLGALEEMSPKAGFQEPVSPNRSPVERAKMLRKKLEDYVLLAAAQVEEFGSGEETARLRAESTSTLIALRELWLHFPEVFEP